MNYLLIKTADSSTQLKVVDDKGNTITQEDWQSDRTLAQGLLEHLEALLSDANITWDELSGIGVFKGPGSFTSLRIGITTANTISYAQHIPIVGIAGDDWIDQAALRLANNEDDQMVMPEYGADPRITLPRK